MFTKLFLVICTMCISVLFIGEGHGQSQELISARVLSSEGQVEIRRQPSDQPQVQKIAFKIEDQLRAGDTIVTGKNGRLVLALSDGSQAVIAPKTTVVIKDLGQSPRTLFNIIRGKTRIHIEKLGGQPNPYRVNTPTAVIAVRGTIFDVLVNEDETQVFLHEGEVAVTNLVLPDQAVFLSAGQMTRVLLQRLPRQPTTFKIGRNDGTFKIKRIEVTIQDNRRIADGTVRPTSSRGAWGSMGGSGPMGGKGSTPPVGGGQPDPGRTGLPTNGSGPNGNSKPPGKKP